MQDLCCAHSRGDILLGKLYRFGESAPVDVAAEFLSLRHATHGRHDPVSDDKGANVFALAFGNEFLDQDVLFLALQQLDEGGSRRGSLSQQHADTLRAFDQLDDDRCASDPFDCRQYVSLVAHKGGSRDADVMSAQDLQAAQFVARIRNA